jgi:hypothetical protein
LLLEEYTMEPVAVIQFYVCYHKVYSPKHWRSCYKAIIFLVVLCKYENKYQESENKVLREVFGPKKGRVS